MRSIAELKVRKEEHVETKLLLYAYKSRLSNPLKDLFQSVSYINFLSFQKLSTSNLFLEVSLQIALIDRKLKKSKIKLVQFLVRCNSSVEYSVN